MLEKILKKLSETDSSAVITFLAEQDNTLVAARSFEELVRHLYWQNKDIPNVILFSRAGIQFGLSQASRGTTDAEKTYQLRSIAKAIAYNLASFTWPGWDEPGVALGATDIAIGLDAARTNLRLAHELDKGALPLSRAYWMLAAQELAVSNIAAAKDHFEQGATYAEHAGEKPEALLCQGFAYVSTNFLLASNATEEKLAAVKAALAPLEHGTDYIAQIETAEYVFK